MRERDNSGQAFPSTVVLDPDGDPYIEDQGMTLRDWFAGQALSGYVASHSYAEAARVAYDYADAMLKARED